MHLSSEKPQNTIEQQKHHNRKREFFENSQQNLSQACFAVLHIPPDPQDPIADQCGAYKYCDDQGIAFTGTGRPKPEWQSDDQAAQSHQDEKHEKKASPFEKSSVALDNTFYKKASQITLNDAWNRLLLLPSQDLSINLGCILPAYLFGRLDELIEKGFDVFLQVET